MAQIEISKYMNNNNDNKSKFDLEEIFSQNDKQKFLIHFEYFCKHLRLATCIDSGCHNINDIVSKINDKLLNNVCLSDFKYEKLLITIPWQKYLYHPSIDLCLKPEVLNRFLVEYIQIFPNRCEKFLDNFIFLLRGDPSKSDETKIIERERLLFSSMKNSIKLLIQNVKNFELIFVRLIKKRYPYLHNANIHEFICYTFNIINCMEMFSFENSIDMFDFLLMKLLEIDLEQFFDEFSDPDKENAENVFNIELEMHDATYQEQFKKAKILDSILVLLFEYVDNRLNNQKQKQEANESPSDHHWDRMIEIITSIFFQRILSSNSVHCQYLIFYICSQSKPYCDILVNDLWTLTTSAQTSILIRESSFNVLVSLFLNARFISNNTVFSFLKIILQWLNSFLLEKTLENPLSKTLNENDLMYYNLCIGFCKIFSVFHNDLPRNQIDCLKNMELKRAIFNSIYKPLQYLPMELRNHFVHLSSYYRIGYASLIDIHNRTLDQTFPNHHEKTCHFGAIYLRSVKTKIELFVYDLEMLSNRTNENISYRIRDELISDNLKRRQGWNNNIDKKALHIATSPNLTTTSASDDAMTSPTDGGSDTPVTSFIITHMLSDCEMID